MIDKEHFGYCFASNRLFEKQEVGYWYYEQPDNSHDSGWRFFYGDESQEYCDDPDNFVIVSIKSILKVSPELETVIEEFYDGMDRNDLSL